MNTLLFTTIKNDNFILNEWVRHHLELGFTQILIYDNNDGREDYPMSEYIIRQCSLKKVKIVNRRNESIIFENELDSVVKQHSEFDFIIGLKVNEFMKVNAEDMNINDLLNAFSKSLSINRIPMKINGKIDLSHINSLSKVTFFKTDSNNDDKMCTDLISVEKYAQN